MSIADDRAGFTLVEAAAALAILGVVVVGWLAAVGAEVSSLSTASEAVTASSLAQDRLTAIRLFRGETEARLPDSLRAGRFAPPLERFAWEAESRPSDVDPLLLDVRVTVRWPDGRERLDGRIRVTPRPVSPGGPGSGSELEAGPGPRSNALLDGARAPIDRDRR